MCFLLSLKLTVYLGVVFSAVETIHMCNHSCVLVQTCDSPYVAIKAHKQGTKQTSCKCQQNIISSCLSGVITYGKKQKINTTPRVKSYDRCSETCQIKKGCMLVLGSSLCMCGLMCMPV